MALLPEDNKIPGAITYSTNLSLAFMPQGSNQGAAIYNSLVRMLDDIALDKNNGHGINISIDDLSITNTITGANINMSSATFTDLTVATSILNDITNTTLDTQTLTAATANITDLNFITSLDGPTATITTLNTSTGNITNVVSTDVTSTTGTIATINSTTGNITNVVATDVTSDTGVFNSITVASMPFGLTQTLVSEIVPNYGITGRTSHETAISFVPHLIEYTIDITDTVATKVTGIIDVRNGMQSYDVVSVGSLITTNNIGLGFPDHNALPFFTIDYNTTNGTIEYTGFNTIDYASAATFKLTFRAIRYPS